MEKMVNSLKTIHGFKTFKICFIGINIGNKTGYNKIETNEFYDVWQLTISPNSFTGGVFTDEISNQNYINIIKSYDIDDVRITKEEIDK
jgi:hypothetical protein